jgi:hypothetical protein
MKQTHNQFLNEHGLADTGTTEKTNLSTTSIRSQEIHNLDTSNEHFSACGLFNKLRRFDVDGVEFDGLDGTSLVDRVTSDVHDTTQSARADRDSDGCASIGGFVSSDETFGTCDTRSESR